MLLTVSLQVEAVELVKRNRFRSIVRPLECKLQAIRSGLCGRRTASELQ